MDWVTEKLPNTSSRLIAMAVSLVGDPDCSGGKEPTWPELDRLVTRIIREQGKMMTKNRELFAQIRAKQQS
jgi:hypothetical protein